MQDNSVKKSGNARQRIVTGLSLAVILCAFWALGGWPLKILLTALMGLCVWEMYGAFRSRADRPAFWVGLGYVMLVLPAYRLMGIGGFAALLAAMTIAGLASIVLRDEQDFPSAMATIYPLFYPGLLMSFVFPILDFEQPMLANVAIGEAFLIALMSDLAAWAVGMRFGRHKMTPNLSPKKSWEGAVAGLLGAIVTAMLVPLAARGVCALVPAARPWACDVAPLWQFALLGAVGGLLSIAGDLNASLVKRYCGIKDYGHLLPGHGGMLDRLDSILFCIPLVWAWFAFIF